jgi:HlyD family secretion protein
MNRRAIAFPVLFAVLGGLLWWRIHLQTIAARAPTGGSATVEGTETVVASKVAGRLIELTVDKGDRVKAGQVVGRLDCSDYDVALAAANARVLQARAQEGVATAALTQGHRNVVVARSQIESVQAQQLVLDVDRDKAALDLNRAKQLEMARAVPMTAYDDASARARGLGAQEHVLGANLHTAMTSSEAMQAAVHTAEAQVAAAAAAIQAAEADVNRAQLSVAECNLVAPRQGIVTERLYEPGVVLPAGARVLTVVDLDTVKVDFFVPDAELGRVKLGAPAELHADAFPGRVFRGNVRRIASEAEFTPRDVQTREDRDRLVYAVEIEIPNEDGPLRAGMPGDVVLPGTGK